MSTQKENNRKGRSQRPRPRRPAKTTVSPPTDTPTHSPVRWIHRASPVRTAIPGRTRNQGRNIRNLANGITLASGDLKGRPSLLPAPNPAANDQSRAREKSQRYSCRPRIDLRNLRGRQRSSAHQQKPEPYELQNVN